jgi:transcriptional regulator with XRE-family HTH domain
MEKAWLLWYVSDYPYKKTDKEIEPFLKLEISSGWLKKAREASLLSTRLVAQRMGIQQSAYHRLETAEIEGKLTLRNLKKCAEAMNCELVYAIRPKEKVIFSEILRKILFEAVKGKPGNILRIGYLFGRHLWDPKFRKKMGWARNTQDIAHEMTMFLKKLIDTERTTNITAVRPSSPPSRGPGA